MTLRPCLDCGTPTDGSWCPEHRGDHVRGSNDHDRTSTQRGYDSAWRRLSRRARRLQPWCTDCGAVDDLTTDHLRWPATDLTDVEVVCRACNSRRGPLRTRGGSPGASEDDRRGKPERASHTPGGTR